MAKAMAKHAAANGPDRGVDVFGRTIWIWSVSSRAEVPATARMALDTPSLPAQRRDGADVQAFGGIVRMIVDRGSIGVASQR